MKYINLLGMHGDYANLRSFAQAFFNAIGITNGEERESGNYVDGYYFKGSLDGMVFSIALSDEEKYEDLLYWICISADVLDHIDFCLFVKKLIIVKALSTGFRLAHIVNFGKRGEQRIDY